MNRRHLRYFIAVANHGGFSAAGRALNVSQPALLYQVNELEQLLGVQLFKRHTRGVDLTDAGARFVQTAKDLLNQYDAIEATAASHASDMEDIVRMGFAPTAARIIAPQLVIRLADENPRLKVTIRQALSGALISSVLQGELDCAFCFEMGDTNGRFLPLFEEDLFLVGAQDEIGDFNETIDFHELSNFRLVIDADYRGTRRIIEDAARYQRVDLNIEVESNLTEITRSLVRFHRRFTIAPLGLYADVLKENGLAVRRIVNPNIRLVGGLVFRAGLRLEIQRSLEHHMTSLAEQQIKAAALGWKRPTFDLTRSSTRGPSKRKSSHSLIW